MTLAEFKAWFDGFTESLDDVPSSKQWKRVKEQVGKIDGTVTTYPVFVDRYLPVRHYPYWSYLGAAGVCQASAINDLQSQNVGQTYAAQALQSSQIPFDATNAMYALGRAQTAGEA